MQVLGGQSMSANHLLISSEGKELELFYAMLVSYEDLSFLPELYDIFGRDNTAKFIEMFAGCSINVPSLEKLKQLYKDVLIYYKIKSVDSSDRKAIVVKTLSGEYDLTEDQIRKIYIKMKVKFEDDLGYKLIIPKRGNRRGK